MTSQPAAIVSSAADVVPQPGTDLVPDGWAESTVIPWADAQIGEPGLKRASAQLAGLEAAYHVLGADTLELVKARRYIEMRWGEVLGDAAEAMHAGVRNPSPLSEGLVSKDARWRFRQLAAAKDRVLPVILAATDAEELSRTRLLKTATGAHVGQNSGDNEWYTPVEYIDAAVAVMGGIDLDPASAAQANEIVGAEQFYDEQSGSLNLRWEGRVWMNPPYARPLIDAFCGKLAESYAQGDVTQACILVNNATETGWFHALAEVAQAMCFPRHRVKFWHPEKVSAPLQGQAVIYMGEHIEQFRTAFVDFGFTVVL